MKVIGLVCLLFVCTHSCAQYKVHFVVTDNAMPKAENIYLAGNFNGWNPVDGKYGLKKQGDNWEITLENIAKGTIAFKCTQGSWETVETNEKGENIDDRKIELQRDTIIYITVQGWKISGVEKPRRHTASANVRVMTDSFYMPQLKRYRRIWIYLPANYYLSTQQFPVLYMQDGQNLFDEYTAPYGEWKVDETMDSLQKNTSKYAIVVGIDHGEKMRGIEYDPYFSKEFGVGEGEAYVTFLVQTLKPFIDAHYRTKKDVTHTGIAGSSLGALICTYAILKYPQSFGSVGVFSPAYWIAPSIEKMAKAASLKKTTNRFWFYGGEKEGFTMMKDMERFKKIIDKRIRISSTIQTDANGTHNEAAWAKWFGAFYIWWYRD